MFFKRIGLVIIAGALIQSGVSCSKGNGQEEVTIQNTNVQTTAAKEDPPVFREKDLGGRDITFMIYNEHAVNYVDSYIWADSAEGGVIAEAVSKRNRETENMYNVNITVDTVYSPKNEATGRIQSGQCDFDVIYEWGTNASTLALDGLLYDFKDLKSVDTGRGYWVPSTHGDLTVGGKMFIATNYITMNSIDYAEMLYFNKTMYEKLGYTESLYDCVTNGTWTTDKLVDIAVSATNDVDGDGEMTSADRYAFWGSRDDSLVDLARSAGAQNTVKNTDGSYSLDVYNQKIVDIYTKYADKLSGKENFITYEDIWQEQPNLSDFSSRSEGARFLGFGEGHIMFMSGTLSLTREFEDMTDDYGILPNPVYDADQPGYCHFIDSNAPMLSVPKDGVDVDITGLVLEYMAYSSEKHLLPAYTKLTTESKKTVDVSDAKMLEFIKCSLRYEWTELYNLQVTNTILGRMMDSGSFKSVYNRLYSKSMAEINGCVNTLSFIGIE